MTMWKEKKLFQTHYFVLLQVLKWVTSLLTWTSGNFSYSSWQILSNSIRLDGQHLWTAIFRSFRRYSMESSLSFGWFCQIDVANGVQPKELNACVIRPENLLPHSVRVLHVPALWLLIMSGFCLATLPIKNWWSLSDMFIYLLLFQQILLSLWRTSEILLEWSLGS